MSLAVAPNAVLLAKIVIVVANQEVVSALNAKCSRQLAPAAVLRLKFLSDQVVTVQFIAVTVFPAKEAKLFFENELVLRTPSLIFSEGVHF